MHLLRPIAALRCVAIAAAIAAAPASASALEVKTLEVDMQIGGRAYAVTAQPMATWKLSSEGQVSLDHKFDFRPDGSHGLIRVRLTPAPAVTGTEQPNPCLLLQGLAQSLQNSGVRVSPGRVPQSNLAAVCSMIAEGAVGTQFYYASLFKSGDVIVSGIARNGSDLDDTQINEFQRFLASVQATPKETTQ